MKHAFILSLAAGLLIVSGLVGCQPAKKDTKAATDTKATTDEKTATAENTATDDLKKMEGTWTLVSGETEGNPLPEQDVKNSKLTIVGDKYTVQLGDMAVKKGTQKLDSTKTPKQIDAKDTEGPTVGENLGIYEFSAAGDFRVCFASTGKNRPTEFVTKPGDGQFIHVWRRAK